MHKASKFVFLALIAMLLLTVRAAVAAPAASEKEKDKVLRRLDEAAKDFRSTQADFQFDSVETDPIHEDDVQKGTVYYERKAGAFQMAAHIREFNGKPAPKVYAYSGGAVRLYEPMVDQLTTLTKAGQYESWFMLGFGASGKELEEKWDIKYLGPEKIDGVTTQKLEMVAKDANVRKNIPKVTVWMDTDRGVSLQQVFDQGGGQSRTCHYTNIKVNQRLPGDAFTFKTDKQTRFVTQ